MVDVEDITNPQCSQSTKLLKVLGGRPDSIYGDKLIAWLHWTKEKTAPTEDRSILGSDMIKVRQYTVSIFMFIYAWGGCTTLIGISKHTWVNIRYPQSGRSLRGWHSREDTILISSGAGRAADAVLTKMRLLKSIRDMKPSWKFSSKSLFFQSQSSGPPCPVCFRRLPAPTHLI